jgi:hypothetical protein
MVDTNNCGPGQTWQRFTGLIDTYLQGLVTPIDSDTVELHFAFSQPKSLSEEKKQIAALTIAELIHQAGQDIPIWEHKRYLENPTLCDGDGPINQYRKWFRQFYADPVPEQPINVRAVG